MAWTKVTHYSESKKDAHLTAPLKSGDYWITDGYVVHMAHYDMPSKEWGIYQPDKWGVIRHCFQLSDMNFDLIAFCLIKIPNIPKRFTG